MGMQSAWRLAAIINLQAKCIEQCAHKGLAGERHVCQQPGRQGGPACRLEGEQHDQRILEQVVVERAEELRNEKRQEAPRLQQFELSAHP